jgi:hypothetical protein
MFIVVLGFASACVTVRAATEPTPPRQAVGTAWSTPANVIDLRVEPTLKQHAVQLRTPCTDEVFIRRVFIDLIGTLPTPKEVDAFLQDPRPDKRATLIDALFTREEFADYWALKWCDVLRVKSEFPSNLWPNAVQAYHRWIYEAIRDNRPYDQFARELLTASGSNFRVPPVNFYRALSSREPFGIAKAVALNFMGTRLERWPEARRNDMALFFSRVAYKKTGEWKEEIVYASPEATEPLKAVFPDGVTTIIPADADPRQTFANWLLAPGNPWFSRNIVNRIWAWTMGHGVIHEADDIRADNPPACPALLTCLQDELVKSHYDLRHIYRLICNSRTYQQSSVPNGDITDPAVQFAHYTVRRLDAEVLIDALDWIGGSGESYSSAIPEPYTFIPKENRTIALADGSITSAFLANFGRPARDTGLESERNNQPADAQSLYLLNSTDIQRKIAGSPQLGKIIRTSQGKPVEMIRNIYLLLLSRAPTPAESTTAEQYLKANGQSGPAANDLAWALINSKEFLYRH